MSRHNASITALRALMRTTQVVPAEQFDKHVREITGLNHRLIGVVCGSMVEMALGSLLKKFMRNGEGGLFDPHHPLGTFSAKIEMAYAFGLIDQDIRRNADYIREIRNTFAHRIAPTSFNTPEIKAVCKLLTLNYPGFPEVTNPRERYFRTAIQTGKAIIRRRSFAWDAQPATLQ